MLSIIHSCALTGIDAYPVTVEVDIANGLPGFSLVGLPDSAVKESRERVFAALKNSGFAVPSRRIIVNLAPGGIRKEGTSFNLPLALGILLASEQIAPFAADDFLVLGELSLDGSVRPVRGVLSAALHAREAGKVGLIVPAKNQAEAGWVRRKGGAAVFGATSLSETLKFLRNPSFREETALSPGSGRGLPSGRPDFQDVKGQQQAKRAVEVAAAGGHNFLLVGSPGCGKTLLARRMPSILPPMSEDEGLETTRIYSAAGLLKSGGGVLQERPFRSPHHSVSDHALVGGGSLVKPGEISLAHNGVLFLDELPEYRRSALESLRQPLEEGAVTISRVSQSVSFPCRVMLGAAMNPCPCGFLTDGRRRCTCRVEEVIRYRHRISGPLLDRMDIHLELPNLGFEEMSGAGASESSETIRKRVEGAREKQRERFSGIPGCFANAQIDARHLGRFCKAGGNAGKLIRQAVENLGLSARAYDRILKVGRTIADLAGSEDIDEEHVAEAIHYRCLDRQLRPFS